MGLSKKSFLNPLSGWLNRAHPLPVRFYDDKHDDHPHDEWGVWLSIEEVAPLHLAQTMRWQSLIDSRKQTADYLVEAGELIKGLEGAWLDHEEVQMILEELGEPPIPCLPIYLITCTSPKQAETLLYIGKTETTSRFSGGHPAALKLLDPAYDNTEKKIYRATVWFHFDDEYIVLDWLQPEMLAIKVLDSIESQLIYSFKPALNSQKKKHKNASWDFYIHIQNFLEGGFLNDKFVG